MDARSVGAAISRLRKKRGLTQAQLAAKLYISDKAVSRWESGQGYPEITLFPELAAVLGVTVDYLMTGQRKGITMAGAIVADIVKCIDRYPEVGALANVVQTSRTVGGCAANTASDLARIDRSIPVSVVGKIGNDEYGRFITGQLSRVGIDCGRISVSASLPTSYSDVMSLPTGEWAVFTARGANAEFSPADVDILSLNSTILHIGYIGLLDAFDRQDTQYGTAMARFLHDVQLSDIKTSLAVVGNSAAGLREKLLSALHYCDYAIIDGNKSNVLFELPIVNGEDMPNVENIRKTMELIAQCGVKDKVIVHCKTAGFCLDVPTGEFTAVPALQLPDQESKGDVGVGEAFCAGCLVGLYHHYDDRSLLELASAAAASSLFAENTSGGVLSRSELEKLAEKYGRHKL